MLDAEVILRALPLFLDGRRVHRPSVLLEIGFPADLVDRLAGLRKDYVAGVRAPRVHSLDALRAIARDVGADLAAVRSLEARHRAAQYIEAIKVALAKCGASAAQ